MKKDKKISMLSIMSAIVFLLSLLLSLVNVTNAWFSDVSANGNKTISTIIKTSETNLNVYQEDSAGVQTLLPKSLPSGYTQLEYLEGNGTQHIDTGVVPTSSMRFTGHTYFQRSTTSADNYLFVSGTTYSNFVGLIASKMRFYAGVGDKSTFLVDYPSLQDYYDLTFDYSYNTTTATLKSNIVTASTTYENSTLTTSNILLFGRRDDNIFLVRFYNFAVYSEDVLVRNFVPAKNSSGTLGMYDLVEDKFYPNAGTGTFVAGGEVLSGSGVSLAYDSTNKTNNKVDVVALPAGYTQLEYLESTGTQYLTIISGAVDNTYGLEMDFSINSSNDNYLAGFSQTNDNRFLFWGIYHDNWRYGWGDKKTNITLPAYSISSYPIGLNNYYTASLNYLNNGKAIFDYQSADINGYGTSFSNIDFYLFKSYSSAMECRIKSAVVTKGTKIIRRLVPAKNSSGTLGMYDLVEGKFYTNAGTGTFVAGEEISGAQNSLKLLLKNEDLGKSFGVRFKATIYAATATGKVELDASFAGFSAPTSNQGGWVYDNGWYYYRNSAGENIALEPATMSGSTLTATERYLFTSFTINENEVYRNLIGGNALYLVVELESVAV